MIELGRYLLVERLGSGALTEAYRAKSFGVEGFEKTLCVKRLLPNRAEIHALASAFVELAQASLSLSHANVAQVIDLGRATAATPGEGTREHVFVATELVEGIDLATLVARASAEGVDVPLGVALLVGAEIAKALGHAHRRRSGAVLHGALTPRSVFVSWEGEVKVTDFAIGRALTMAKFEADDARSAPYLGPEALRGEGVVPASDLYSLGATLFELLTRKRPLAPGPPGGAERASVGACELRRDLPQAVDALLARMMTLDPARRTNDAASLHEELVSAAYATGSSPSPVDLGEFVSRLGRRAQAPAGAEADAASILASSTPAPGSARPARAERREATLFVIDGLEVLGGHDDARRAELRSRVERAGGVVVSVDASELRAVFGLVEADGRDAHTAVEVGLDITNHFPELGVGIDLARVTADEAGALVADADLAPAFAPPSRLAAGGRGKVRLERAAARSVGAEFELEADGPHQRAVAPRAGGLPLSRFVGRKRELEAVGRAFASAMGGASKLVVITGERGLGKTRLLGEIALRLAKLPAGVEIARASCPRDVSGAPAPFSALAELLRALVGISGAGGSSRELLAKGAGHDRDEGIRKLRALGLDEADVEELTLLAVGRFDGERAEGASESRVAGAFDRAVERLTRDRPLVLGLDDAQYLDADSARVLDGAASAPSRRLLVLAVGRVPPAGLGPDCETIELAPLDVDEVALVAAGVIGARVLPPELVRYVAERAQGVPLAIELVLKELSDSALVSVRQGTAEVDLERATVPRGLRALVEGKLAKLGIPGEPPSPRDVLRALAILGDSATADDAAALVGAPVDRVRAALRSRDVAALLEPGGRREPRLAASMAEVILDTIPPDERRAAHAQAAAHLAESGEATGEGLDRIATHLAASGAPDEAAMRFAEASRLHVRPDLAARSAARALATATLDQLPAATLRDWLATLARSALRSHARVRTGDLAHAILERVDACGDAPDRIAARLDIARMAALESSFEEAHVVLERARSLAVGTEQELMVLATEVEIAERSGEIERARDAAVTLLERSTAACGNEPATSADPRLLLDVASVLCQALDLDRAGRALDAAFDGAIAGSAMLRASVEVRRAELLLASADPTAAHRSALLGADLAEAHGLTFEVARAKIALGAAYRALGRRERAYAAYVEATEASEAGGHDRLRSISRAGVTLLEGLLLQSSRSQASAEALGRIAKETDARGFAADAIRVRLFWAELLDAQGARDEARAALDAAGESARLIGHPALAREVEQALAEI